MNSIPVEPSRKRPASEMSPSSNTPSNPSNHIALNHKINATPSLDVANGNNVLERNVMRRATRACDHCHHKGKKCIPRGDGGPGCDFCFRSGEVCTSNRLEKKRGQKTAAERMVYSGPDGFIREASSLGDPNAQTYTPAEHDQYHGTAFTFPLRDDIAKKVIENMNHIEALVEIYFDEIHPLFPVYHEKSWRKSFKDPAAYLTDQAFFAGIMGICALSSARIRDGFLILSTRNVNFYLEPTPEWYYMIARGCTLTDAEAMRGNFEWLRTVAVLARYGLQINEHVTTQRWMGMYQSLVRMDELHLESNWSIKGGLIEEELRRRLFWSMYTLDIYCSFVWGSSTWSRASEAIVDYPSEIADEHFNNRGYKKRPKSETLTFERPTRNPNSWLHGFNFITDMFRILEDVKIETTRRRSSSSKGPSQARPDLARGTKLDLMKTFQTFMEEHASLPDSFKAPTMEEDERTRCQAANIQTVMFLLGLNIIKGEGLKFTAEEKCKNATETFTAFSKIDLPFLYPILNHVVYHLDVHTKILKELITSKHTEESYVHLRATLLKLSNLLETINSKLKGKGIGGPKNISQHIEEFDKALSIAFKRPLLLPEDKAKDPTKMYFTDMTFTLKKELRREFGANGGIYYLAGVPVNFKPL